MKILNKPYTYILLATILVIVASCEEDFDHDISSVVSGQSSGSADFTRYVALGNSLTSGYANSALYISGQKNSYPAILSERFKQSTPNVEDFKLPLVKDEIGGLVLNGREVAKTKLILNSSLSPVNIEGVPSTDISSRIGVEGPYGNLGVPGAKSYHLLAEGYGSIAGVEAGTANPYYAYFATSDTSTVVADAVAQDPTFFTLWIGNNDILAYSTAGGDESGIDQTGNFDPSQYGSNDISDPNVVINSIGGIVDALTANGGKGVIANIPSVTSIPYFTTVPYNSLAEQILINETDDRDIINTLNMGFAGLNQIFEALGQSSRKIEFMPGRSNVVIKDINLVDIGSQITGAMIGAGIDSNTAGLFGDIYGQARQADESDLIVLTASGLIGKFNIDAYTQSNKIYGSADNPVDKMLFTTGVTYPLDGSFVLTKTEQEKVEIATDAYNAGIENIAASNPDIAMVDMKQGLQDLASTGFIYDGNIYTDDYIVGASFSLDGVHPTSRGYAIVANYFIRAINDEFGASLLEVNPNSYSGL